MHLRVSAVVLIAIVVFGCTTSASSPTVAPQATSTAPSPAGFKNLQVLPHDISRDQLLGIMRTFTRSLGVRCDQCHVVTATTPKEEFDFPSDAKKEKQVARVMVRMTQQINDEWLERVEQVEGPSEPPAGSAPEAPRVGCWTCHRGHPEPEMMPPSPPPPPQK